MIEQYLTPEIIILAAAAACLAAVLVLVFASKQALQRGLAAKLAALETQIAERKRLLEDIGSRTAEAAELEKRVDYLQKRLTALQQELDPIEGKHLKALTEYEDAKAKLRETREEWNQLKERVDLYKDRVSKVDALEKEIADLQKKRNELEALIKDLPKRQEELAKVEEILEQQKKAMAKQEKTMSEMDTEKDALAEKISAGRKAVEECEDELRKRREEIGKLENAQLDLNARVDTLQQKLRKGVRLSPEAFESLMAPVFPVSECVLAETNEQTALSSLRQLVTATGFEIPVRLQNAFHTALKTSDISCLTVMAGVSGTGKSAFPKLYSQAMGLHFLPLAVEPRWDSPKDLFGFLNYMENRFEATTLGRSLVQFNDSPHEPGELEDQMLLVLLDEMNLARIEYYFSEFLSKLEMRRNCNVEGEEDYKNVSVEIFAGYPGDEDFDPSDPVRLYAGRNVLFVGTMNEDESTQSLSDKVIDRANVLYFGKPNRLSEKHQRSVPSGDWVPISASDWRQWIKEPSVGSIPGYDQIDDLVNNINGVLAQLGRPFGWRTYKAIMAYIANHPDVTSMPDTAMIPLADQVAMRVMPKLRGVDLQEHGNVFNALGQLLQQIDNASLRDAFNRARESSQGFFDWRGMSWEG